jgi:hypothetical protein
VLERVICAKVPSVLEAFPMRNLSLLLFIAIATLVAHAGDERQPVFVKARCNGWKSSIVLGWLTKSVGDSPKYRLVSDLGDNGHLGVVIHTIYMTCAENKESTAIATQYGIAKCQSSKECHSVTDGDSLNVGLCDASVLLPDCGRALFKGFETYMSIPNRPLKLE